MKQSISTAKGIFVFSSTIIGAGILALPVAAATSGLLPLLVMLILLAVVSIFSALYISEAVLCTDDSPHLPSLALKYLGNRGLAVMVLGTMIYIYGALVGYLTAGGQLLFFLSNKTLPVWAGTLIYFALTALIIHYGLILASYVETYLFYMMIVLLGWLMAIALPHVKVPLLLHTDWISTPDVFGIVLFAYVGHSVIPSIAHGLQEKKNLVRVAFWGIAIPFVLYSVWSLTVIGIVPPASEWGYSLMKAKAAGQPATIPLGFIVGGSVILLGNLFAVFSTMTSYIGFGLSLKDEYANIAHLYRKKIPGVVSTALVITPPLIIALFNPHAFVNTLEIAGAYGGGIFVGILPSLIIIRLRKTGVREEFITWGGSFMPYLVLGIYLLGILYTTVQLFMGRG